MCLHDGSVITASIAAVQADTLMLRKSLPGDATAQYTCIVDTAVYSRCGDRERVTRCCK